MTHALALILLAAGSSPIDAEAADAAVGLDQQQRAASVVSTATQLKTGSSDAVVLSTAKRPNDPAAADRQQAEPAVKPQGLRAMTSRERILRRRRASRATLQGGQQQTMDGLISLIQSTVAPDCWEFSGGGFSGFGAAASGNNAGSGRQNAQNLAELIQQTTRPLSWEINGGSGSISIFP
jgi:hypothetical protein